MRSLRPAPTPLLALLAALAMVACAAPDDDDSAPGGLPDDDDSAAAAPIRAVTFAATVQGIPADWTGDDGAVTELSGTFHLLYWVSLEDRDLHCRQRVGFEAQARFGAASTSSCADCAGRLVVTSAWLLPPDEFEDGCAGLSPEVDLSFLVASTDVAMPADFRQLQFVPAAQLLAEGGQFGVPGPSVAQVLDRYQVSGLEVLHVAYVEPAGWLAATAGLDEVAVPRGPGLLPMFVVYADGGTVGSPVLEGSTYLSTLWTVRVGDGLETDSVQ